MNAPLISRPRGLSRWRGRDVVARTGYWSELREQVPRFETWPFAVDGGANANPHLQSVVRQPIAPGEDPIPVGVVSPTYALVQHRNLGDRCVEILKRHDLFYDRLRCDLELTALGEWMHLGFYLGDDFSLTPPDGHPLELRVELFNSVDGSSRLIVLMSWFRLVCSNGLVVRDTLAQLAKAHDRNLDLGELEGTIVAGLRLAEADRERLGGWYGVRLKPGALTAWIDGPLAAKWGKKAAARCLHICSTGRDGEPINPFDGGKPSERLLRPTSLVPGAAAVAETLYDAGQAVAWIASHRPNVEERLSWQTDVPQLMAELSQLHAR